MADDRDSSIRAESSFLSIILTRFKILLKRTDLFLTFAKNEYAK